MSADKKTIPIQPWAFPISHRPEVDIYNLHRWCHISRTWKLRWSLSLNFLTLLVNMGIWKPVVSECFRSCPACGWICGPHKTPPLRFRNASPALRLNTNWKLSHRRYYHWATNMCNSVNIPIMWYRLTSRKTQDALIVILENALWSTDPVNLHKLWSDIYWKPIFPAWILE